MQIVCTATNNSASLTVCVGELTMQTWLQLFCCCLVVASEIGTQSGHCYRLLCATFIGKGGNCIEGKVCTRTRITDWPFDLLLPQLLPRPLIAVPLVGKRRRLGAKRCQRSSQWGRGRRVKTASLCPFTISTKRDSSAVRQSVQRWRHHAAKTSGLILAAVCARAAAELATCWTLTSFVCKHDPRRGADWMWERVREINTPLSTVPLFQSLIITGY